MSSQDLQIDWLRTFLAVVDSGSLTAAARQVSRSQSAVSMQIKKLEDSVGRPLLLRGPRQLALTPAGYDLLGRARELMELHTSTLSALHGGKVSGRVTVGVPDDYAMAYMAPVLRAFSGRFSEVEITLVCEESTALLVKVDRGEIDLALTTRDIPGRGDFLFHEDLIWVGSDQYEVWKREPLPIAVHEFGDRLRAEVLAALSNHGRDFRVVYNSPNVAGQLTLAESGLAVAVITRCSLPPSLKVLDTRHGLPELPELDIVVARSKQSKRSTAVTAMHDQIIRTHRAEI